MSALQQPRRLILSVVPQDAWDGDVLIRPVLSDDDALPVRPGEKAGDVIFGDSVLWVSLGSAEKLSPALVRRAGERVAHWLRDHVVPEAGLPAAEFVALEPQDALQAFCEGLLLGAFRFSRHRSALEDQEPIRVQVLTEGADSSFEGELDRLAARVDAVNLAREWSHEPPNVINPLSLAERARTLAREHGLKYTVLGEADLREIGAGAILAVGQGSATPSQLIVLEYPGRGAGRSSAPVVVVGKAITFDTGGYSLKNTKGIVGMKFDKCGGMAVLGILQAAARLQLTTPVVGIVAAAENMISAQAYRPNDIVTSLSGKTIEIISTDAEGRMVLADALTYAARQYQPRAIVDLATLTGGVRVALGTVRAGLLATDDDLAQALLQAGERTGERLWRLPLDEEYFELIRGSDSDLKNSAGVPLASPIVGGMFLRQFVPEGISWAHIDIAGTATVEKGPSGGQEATGFGVRLVVDYLKHLT